MTGVIEIVQFCIQLFRLEINLILPMIKRIRKSMVLGLLKHKNQLISSLGMLSLLKLDSYKHTLN